MNSCLVFVLVVLVSSILIGLLPYAWPFILIYLTYRIIRAIRKEQYFKSEEFKQHKDDIKSLTDEYNEISNYVKELPSTSQFVPAEKKDYSHLAKSENTSKHNYVRDKERKKHKENVNVHTASLAVVRKAEEKPIQYLTKYFNIESNEETLQQLQEIETNISRSKNAIINLEKRRKKIEDKFNPPKFILKYYHDELSEKIGMNVPDVKMKYAEYIFEYVSPGGNSSQRTRISFDVPTINATADYIADRTKYLKTAKAQRALMTEDFRTYIKERDSYTCQMCSTSIEDQDLLLLEVDHIIPVSKGGKSVEDNLQTLCWKCNRTKGSKILSEIDA